jgi:hypothetical protein
MASGRDGFGFGVRVQSGVLHLCEDARVRAFYLLDRKNSLALIC